jgi:hypothetical protein
MKLVVHEIVSWVEQELVPAKNTLVAAVRPHIYRHGSPPGSLYCEIYEGSALIATSESVPISSIASGSNYFHGYVRFYVDAWLAKDTAYKIRILGTGGYFYDDSAYCGVCGGFDLGKYAETYTPSNDYDKPIDIEIWKRNYK